MEQERWSLSNKFLFGWHQYSSSREVYNIFQEWLNFHKRRGKCTADFHRSKFHPQSNLDSHQRSFVPIELWGCCKKLQNHCILLLHRKLELKLHFLIISTTILVCFCICSFNNFTHNMLSAILWLPFRLQFHCKLFFLRYMSFLWMLRSFRIHQRDN